MINYYNFKKWGEDYLVTNDMGRFLFLTEREFKEFSSKRSEMDSQLHQKLLDKYFVLENNNPVQLENAQNAYRYYRQYLFQGTNLHIFVVTNRCNFACSYCQAQDQSNSQGGYMTKEIAKKATDIALSSAGTNLTFEFQGGEPLLNYEIVKYIIEYAEAKSNDRVINYTIVTNGTLLDSEKIFFFRQHNVDISVSFDGCREVHDANRTYVDSGEGTFSDVVQVIDKLQQSKALCGTLQTTTKASLKFPVEIIREYVAHQLHSIFVRPLTPLGYARNHWDSIGYSPEEFLKFYRKVLEEIIRVNREGYYLSEGHAEMFLRKIFTHDAGNYMELRSPCGASVGQIAYYYDGNIYSCDEGRMIAQMGDDIFKLGDVYESSYDCLMNSNTCRWICQATVLEGLPGCCDCVYQPYCGVCPVLSYAYENDVISGTYENFKCRIYKGILDYLFTKINRHEDLDILYGWVGEKNE